MKHAHAGFGLVTAEQSNTIAALTRQIGLNGIWQALKPADCRSG
jgi:hypothetical protein